MVNVKQFSDNWAYDISKNVLSKGEIYNNDVIKQSIELILATMFNERLFNLTFGSSLGSYFFHFINKKSGETLLDSIISAINTWENRVQIISQNANLQILNDQEAIIISLPYIIKQNGVGDTFKKKIQF